MGNSQFLINEKEQVYKQPQDYSEKFFSEFVKDKISRLLDEEGEESNKLTIAKEKEKIANQLGINYELFKKYINEQKQIKKRDLVIAICILIKATSDETGDLFLYFKMKEWEPASHEGNTSRDDIFMEILDIQETNTFSLDEVDERLSDMQFNTLDIIDHKIKKKKLTVNYPYPLIKKKIECRVDELIYGDQYNSLSKEYDINRYHIIARMWLGTSKEDYYELHTENEGIFYIKKNTDVLFESYKNLEDTGEFKDCFIELSKMVELEKKSMAKILNDTKNYKCRRSARVIENELHVFYETYNYSIPELCEYYLMDYVNGEYTLYVSKNSMFMRFYLPEKVYNGIYGKSIDIKTYLKKLERYNSIESMEKKLESEKKHRNPFLKKRISAFKTIKLEIDTLIENLTTGKVHILNLEYVFNNTCDILKYYNVTEEFQCVYDEEYGKITNGIDKATFSIDNNQDIELTFENLIDGFELGLGSIDEIGKFLLQHKSLKIADCITNGTI